MNKHVSFALAFLVGAILAPAAHAGTLRIEISNVRNTKGMVHVHVCPEKLFLEKDCPYGASAPASAGVTVLTVDGVPPGRFAVQAFHDENRNEEVDQMLFGIPKEGIAFSNDAKIRFGPPKFADAMFIHSGDAQTLRMRMRYFSGASGPPGKR